MFIDRRVIQQHGAHAVLAHRQAVAWPNGCAVGLHRVLVNGRDDMYLRAVQGGDLRWTVFDLRDVANRDFEADVKALPPRDTDGMVFYALRLNHAGAAPFLAAAARVAKGSWRGGEGGAATAGSAEWPQHLRAAA